VTIGLLSSNDKEGTVDKKSVVFTSTNWDAPQMITVTGVDDTLPDGPQNYSIATSPALSDDPAYRGVDAAEVAITNTDDDFVGITVTPTSGLKTTEMGDSTMFKAKLNTKPSSDVSIAISSSNDKEGVVSPKALVFTTENWNAPQTVTVTGVDDAAADGPQTYKILTAPAKSADRSYDGPVGDDMTVVNGDDETPGVTVAPASGLTTTEDGGTAAFTMRLNSKPTANVTIGFTSSNDKEGTVSPKGLVFTADNWNAPQTVTITGVDDPSADGNQPYKVVLAAASSGDLLYNGFNPADVSITNTDDDSAGITVWPAIGPIATTEAGGTATFTIRLNARPTADVTIPLSSSKTSEGTVSPARVTFTATNWNAPQTVTIIGVDDKIADGAQPYRIRIGAATSSDARYADIDAADVAVSNTDDDSAGMTVPSGIR